MGGALWASELATYDLLGLTDQRIARTIGRDQPSFHDYVFDEVRPTFIKTMDFEVGFSRLEEDSRFFRDYQLLLGDWNSSEWRPWATPIRGILLFVRKESIAQGRRDTGDPARVRRELPRPHVRRALNPSTEGEPGLVGEPLTMTTLFSNSATF